MASTTMNTPYSGATATPNESKHLEREPAAPSIDERLKLDQPLRQS
jgi:hypothetical protein